MPNDIDLKARLREDLTGLTEAILDFAKYLDDYNSLGGGAMRQKYGEDPMKGFENVVERFRPIIRQARALQSGGQS